MCLIQCDVCCAKNHIFYLEPKLVQLCALYLFFCLLLDLYCISVSTCCTYCAMSGLRIRSSVFRANRCFFTEQKSDVSESLTVALLLKSQANLSHCSFLKSDESDLLMTLFCKMSDFERMSEFPTRCNVNFLNVKNIFPRFFPIRPV